MAAKRTDWEGSVPPNCPLRGAGWVSRPRHAQRRVVLRSRLSPEIWDILPNAASCLPLCHAVRLDPSLPCGCRLDDPDGGGLVVERALARGERASQCCGQCPGRRAPENWLIFPEPQLLYLQNGGAVTPHRGDGPGPGAEQARGAPRALEGRLRAFLPALPSYPWSLARGVRPSADVCTFPPPTRACAGCPGALRASRSLCLAPLRPVLSEGSSGRRWAWGSLAGR